MDSAEESLFGDLEVKPAAAAADAKSAPMKQPPAETVGLVFFSRLGVFCVAGRLAGSVSRLQGWSCSPVQQWPPCKAGRPPVVCNNTAQDTAHTHARHTDCEA